MASNRRKRIRSPHPGVYIIERTLPSGAVAHRARYVDADTRRTVWFTLDPVELRTREAREEWAKRKSRELAKRRMDLAAGAPKLVPVPIADAVERYTTACEERLRKSTVTLYKTAATIFQAWTGKAGIETTADLNSATLAGFRESLISRKRKHAIEGGKRGERVEREDRISATSVNIMLRATKTMLAYFRTHGLAVHLSRDAIADALKPLALPREQPAYLTPSQLQRLLHAALKHDAATFIETRNEHAGRRVKGTTPRYVPIAPFIAFLVLTGCRRGEALSLLWSDVDLEARDHDGRLRGEIRIRAEISKTKRARTVDLEVSPALRKVLAAIKPDPAKGHVFGGTEPYTSPLIEATRKRLISDHEAPVFDWQMLRSTCSTYLTNAPGIFSAATAFLSAKQLGHSVEVAERHYVGLHRGIPREARTLEAAMQIELAVHRMIVALGGAPAVAAIDAAE